MEVEKALQALRPLPSVKGELLSDEPDVVRLRTAGAILEVPRRFVADWREAKEGVELTLAIDAVIVVSTVVSSRKGFVAADVFGSLSPSLMADNCNCNCNCNSGNCNCNCNCSNCDCGGSGCAGGSILMSEAEQHLSRTFRQGSRAALGPNQSGQQGE
jgi:hypothetical protein